MWSALEYAAQVRDVLALFRNRVGSAITEEEPDFGWWTHEAAAVDEGYNEQDPPVVAAMLESCRAGRDGPARRGSRAWHRAGHPPGE